MRQLHFATAPDGATPRNTKHKLPPYKHLVIAVGDCDTPVVWAVYTDASTWVAGVAGLTCAWRLHARCSHRIRRGQHA